MLTLAWVSNGSNATSTSSNIHPPCQLSKLSNTYSPKELTTPSIDYVYPQRLPLKETQANINLAANLSHTTQTKDPKPPCVAPPIIPTPAIPPLSLQEPVMHVYEQC